MYSDWMFLFSALVAAQLVSNVAIEITYYFIAKRAKQKYYEKLKKFAAMGYNIDDFMGAPVDNPRPSSSGSLTEDPKVPGVYL